METTSFREPMHSAIEACSTAQGRAARRAPRDHSGMGRHGAGCRDMGRRTGVVKLAAAAVLLAVFPAVMQAQAAGLPDATPTHSTAKTSQTTGKPAYAVKAVTAGARRHAARLYLEASKRYVGGRFERALTLYQQAAKLDPDNADYPAAAEVARSHAVAALIQASAKDRAAGNAAGADAALERARRLDPSNPEVAEHLYQLADDAVREQPAQLYDQSGSAIGNVEPLRPELGTRSFHLRADQRQIIEKVFKKFGVTALIDDSVRDRAARFDIDDADFAEAARALGLVTNTFYVPLDGHRVLVARDTRENRRRLMRSAVETVYLAGLTSDELTAASNLARNVFGIRRVAADASNSTLTVQAPPETLDAFNAQMRDLFQGHDQVMVDMRIIQLAHTSEHNTGIQPPQSISAINVYAEEQSILNQNQALVQQIISSGLASPGDTLAILGILLASGQVSSSLFSNGLALFGGGLTQSALAPGGPATLNFNLNSSDSRTLDDIQLRLGDNEAGTVKEVTKYPIVTSSFGSPASSLPNIPGLTGAGASGALGSLLSSLASAATVPIIQYQDLGLTLKVTPKVLRGSDVALTIDLKISALSGQSLNNNPILNNEAFSGVVTLKKGETAELVSQLNKSESRAISGTPGLSEVPGMNDITDKDIQKNYATLLILMTPHVVRATQPAGHSPAMVIEKTAME